ncbi:MAG: CBS domain-containing protein [Turicibacter sp.]
MKVKQLMTDGIEALTPNDTVLIASRLMKKCNIGSLPVIGDDSKVIGIVTDRDIVIRVFADILPMNTKVEEIMTSPVFCITENSEIGSAISLMADKQVRRLPVIDDAQQLVGLISLGDLAMHQLTDGRAGNALKEISEPNTNPNKDLEVDDFPM